MPRSRRLRKIVAPPNFKGYKPHGAKESDANAIELLYEEYEAIKLADYDLMNHKEAAKLMGISRPTFARIYESARRKIAQAFVETREIITLYGNAILDKNWCFCLNCQARFSIPATMHNNECPICLSKQIEAINNES